MSAPSTAELPIQEATLELIRWFIPILHRLPRLHRHGLGDRLVANLYELLEQLALARFQRERLEILEPLRGRIQLIQQMLETGATPGREVVKHIEIGRAHV